ncbi:MAG: N-acetyl-gamma-glutamyl-phosphate reductase [Clostridia bacterium]|nr:N-acetyl-gamma-glutamyl-phosphate reductase [Clostridia bacterium]
MLRVFIDGSAGTTGLRIADRLAAREDIRLITLPEETRKDPAARHEALNSADVCFLCLPDDAAREAVSMVENPETVVIDTSTAHRVQEGWCYGLPELPGMREKLVSAKRIANPGCHATGFIVLAAPLVAAGFIAPDARLSCFSLTGYSGGGKKMIAQYEMEGRDVLLDAPRLYGLTQKHKHLPEMAKWSGLQFPPVFSPIVAPYYAGMEVVISLTPDVCKGSVADLADVYKAAYPGGMIHFDPDADESGFLSAGAYAGRDDLSVSVYGGDERILAVTRFDNLGKGASGAAIQNMNIAFGLDEKTGLVI